MKRAVQPRSGSALGFSQPLSGFLARPSFATLFRAATVPGILPLERSPRKDRAPLSRPLCSPAVIHLRAEPYCPSALSPPVSPTPALLTQLPGSLERLWTPFSPAEARFPVVLGSAQQNRFIPPASPTSKRLSPHESVRNQRGLPRPWWPLLLGFFPSRAFSVHASRPHTRPGLADLNPSLRPKTSGPRPSRPAASRTG
jgi:hypothetical protein